LLLQIHYWVSALSLIAETGVLALKTAGQVVDKVLRINNSVVISLSFREAESQTSAAQHVHTAVVVQLA